MRKWTTIRPSKTTPIGSGSIPNRPSASIIVATLGSQKLSTTKPTLISRRQFVSIPCGLRLPQPRDSSGNRRDRDRDQINAIADYEKTIRLAPNQAEAYFRRA